MNRTLATWLSLITVLAVAALAIAIVGLVLGAKASDEKADYASVTQQLDELHDDVETRFRQSRHSSRDQRDPTFSGKRFRRNSDHLLCRVIRHFRNRLPIIAKTVPLTDSQSK